MILAIQALSLMAAIWMTFVNIGCLVRNKGIGALQLLIMSGGWSLFIITTWLI